MKMSVLTGFVVATFAISASAHGLKCSIAPPAHASDAQLATLAKISKDMAQATALKAVDNAAKKTIKSAELEAEHGCLIWSFDIGIAGSTTTHEVAIDAGNGNVLTVTQETPKQEADEARSDSQPSNAQH